MLNQLSLQLQNNSRRFSMRYINFVASITLTLSLTGIASSQSTSIPTPKVLVPGWTMELVDSEPNIVTPTAIECDRNDNLYVVECHTHFPPENYSGPKKDRIYVYIDKDKDGKFENRELFYEGGVATMALACDEDGWVYVGSRSKIIRLRDSDGDFKSDQEEQIIKHETEANYPHNGLSSLLLTNDGSLMFGQGENFGEPYKVIGTDGSMQVGGGEGGNVYKCDRDGKNVVRFATGFWNPFGLKEHVIPLEHALRKSVAQGSFIFAVDNDPDATPPNRLLHVEYANDYGFQFRFGRAGTHPLLSWNGEFPGTRGMVEGVGEAACAVQTMPIEGSKFSLSDTLPIKLWVSSWGDNRIEQIDLTYASDSSDRPMKPITSNNETVVQGTSMFRPVDFAVTSKGVVYVSDWVDRSYSVHQKGRLWKLTCDEATKSSYAAKEEFSKSDTKIAGRDSDLKPIEADPMREAVTSHWTFMSKTNMDAKPSAKASAKFVAFSEVSVGILSEYRELRLYCIRWAAESSDVDYLSFLERNLKRLGEEPTGTTPLEVAEQEREFAVTVAAIKTGSASGQRTDPAQDELLADIIFGESHDSQLQTFAIRRLSPAHKIEDVDSISAILKANKNAEFLHEVIVYLASRKDDVAKQVLNEVIKNPSAPEEIRADAVAALASIDRTAAMSINADASALQIEIDRLKALDARIKQVSDNNSSNSNAFPSREDTEAWLESLKKTDGERKKGWRVWATSQCVTCHAINGRGATVGPDLYRIAKDSEPKQLLQSILQPSKEIAPLHQTWKVLTTEGKVIVGSKVNGGGVGESNRYLLADGSTVDIAQEDIEDQQAVDTSIMPENIVFSLSQQELRDMLEFLNVKL
jgi:putative membrane-bound dehydrogenase-like protein